MSEHSDPANAPPPSVDRVSALWRRINEHKLVQWSVAYVALAYGIQHGVTLTVEAFDWPHAVTRVSMLLLILGLPVVMTLAWYHGARASRQFSHAELSILSALLVIGAFLFYTFAQPSEHIASDGPIPPAQLKTGSLPASMSGISIAVLPFANLSGDPSQEFFSDGMTEEITSVLARVQGLTVLARTSAFEFKGQNRNVRDIGEALNARYLIEGSVRKDGDRVRITAQLVQAESGANVWTENYDRQLTNIFAIQEDIAQAIAGALKVPLGLQRGETLVQSRTGSTDTYEQYLRARALRRSGHIGEAVKLLESVVMRDPGFSPAWSLLSEVYFLAPYTSGDIYGAPLGEVSRSADQAMARSEKAAREAIRLNPNDALAYAALARIPSAAQSWAQSEDLFRQALARDPNEADVLLGYGGRLASMGRLKAALEVTSKLRSLEPFVPLFTAAYARDLQLNGQNKAAISILEAIPPDSTAGTSRNLYLARDYAVEGRFAEAADALQALTGRAFSQGTLENAARILRSAPAKASAPEALPELEGALTFVYAYVGAQDRVLEGPERISAVVARSVLPFIWAPEFSSVRKAERFKTYMRKVGLVDYWKARGWPDLCHPVGADDFACN
jgi:TolB-like protein